MPVVLHDNPDLVVTLIVVYNSDVCSQFLSVHDFLDELAGATFDQQDVLDGSLVFVKGRDGFFTLYVAQFIVAAGQVDLTDDSLAIGNGPEVGQRVVDGLADSFSCALRRVEVELIPFLFGGGKCDQHTQRNHTDHPHHLQAHTSQTNELSSNRNSIHIAYACIFFHEYITIEVSPFYDEAQTANLQTLTMHYTADKSMESVRQGARAEPKAIYAHIYARMEKPFAENKGNEELQSTFWNEVSKRFKISLTFDDQAAAALAEHFQQVCDDYRGTADFDKKLNFVDKVNQLLWEARYIGKRDYYRLEQRLRAEFANPTNKYLAELDYIRKAYDLEEFRYEFLWRYCSRSADEANDIMDEIENEPTEALRQQYERFFWGCIDNKIDPKVVNYVEDILGRYENKAEVMSQKLLTALDKRIGTKVGGDDNQIKVNNALVEIAQKNSYSNDRESQQRLEQEVALLEHALNKFSSLSPIKSKGLVLRVGRFGSLISGFAGLEADLDLTILTNSYVKEVQLLKLLTDFLRKEYKEDDRGSGRRMHIDPIIQAKTPLVAVKIVTKNNPEIKIDIIINNILGVLNSRFLAVYSGVRWVKNLGLLIKMWAKKVALIEKNALSSYALILMMLHYLIKKKRVRAILDHRVLTQNTPHFMFRRQKLNEMEEFEVYYKFITNDPKEVSPYERVNYLQILVGFTRYYAEEYWQEKEEDRIITVDQSTQREVDTECAITIKDPFDKPHNPGRMKAESEAFLKQKFKDALEVLSRAKIERVKDLFE